MLVGFVILLNCKARQDIRFAFVLKANAGELLKNSQANELKIFKELYKTIV